MPTQGGDTHLDRELGQQLFFQRDARDFFQQRLEVQEKKMSTRRSSW